MTSIKPIMKIGRPKLGFTPITNAVDTPRCKAEPNEERRLEFLTSDRDA
jgi:hypothetical protein